METVQGTAVIPLNDALECIGAILKLHLGSQTDESSLRGQNYLPGRPLYRERNKKLLQPDLQLALITHRLQAMSARLLPTLPEVGGNTRSCRSASLEVPASPFPFASAARRTTPKTKTTVALRPTLSTTPMTPAAVGSRGASQSASSKKKRKKRSLTGRRKPKKSAGDGANFVLACDGALTGYRADMIADACAVVDVLQPYIDALPWENSCDAEGDVVQLGRKYHSLYLMGKYVSAGWEMTASSGVAEFAYDTSARAMLNIWQQFTEAEQSFVACMSKRGQHPKMQDLLLVVCCLSRTCTGCRYDECAACGRGGWQKGPGQALEIAFFIRGKFFRTRGRSRPLGVPPRALLAKSRRDKTQEPQTSD